MRPLARRVGVTIAALVTAAAPAAAQSWKPAKSVELVVGSAPGGSPDIVARLVQKFLPKTGLVPPSTVVNKPGAANTIAWAYVNKHRGDAHYVATFSPALIADKLMATSEFHYNDFTPLCILAREYVAFVVKGDSPIASLKALTAHLKRDPRSVRFAFATARGNHNHVTLGLYLKSIGIAPKAARAAVYPGDGPAHTALLGGHVDVYVASPRNIAPLEKAGPVRILAISSPQRESGAKSPSTFRELGHDVVFFNWWGFIGPKGLGAAEIAYWDRVFGKLAQNPDWRSEIARNVWSAEHLLSADTREHLEREHAQLKVILTELGLTR